MKKKKETQYKGDLKMVLSKLKEKLEGKKDKGDKKMKVAILGAGCYRTTSQELVKLQKQPEKKTSQ